MLATEEQRLLSLSEAQALLHSLGRTVKRVYRYCEDDAILFLGAFDRPWTAWVSRAEGGMSVQYEEGWSAWLGSCSRVSSPSPVPSARRALSAGDPLGVEDEDAPYGYD